MNVRVDPFSAQSKWYARYRPTYPASVFAMLADRAPALGRAWDCGTGTGQAARNLAVHFDSVVATDMSRSQLRNASRGDRLSYVAARVESSCFADRSFDCVIATQAVHWFDFDSYYAEVRRVARPGALVCFMGYSRVHIGEPVGALVYDFYEEMFGRYFNANRQYVEEYYRTLPFPFEELDAPASSMEYEWTLSDLEGYVVSWSSLQQYRRDQKRDPLPEFMDTVREAWGLEDTRPVRFDGFMRLGLVR